MVKGILTVLQGLVGGLWVVLRTFPAALVFGSLGLLMGHYLVTTPPLSYLLNERLMTLLGLIGLGAGLWLDFRRW